MNNPASVTARLRANGRGLSLSSINLDILIALLPSVLWSVYIFGKRALLMYALALVGALLTELILDVVLRCSFFSILDLSSPVYALVTVMLMPASVPIYLPFAAGVAVVILAKASRRIGSLPINPPALCLSLLVLIFGKAMCSFPDPIRLPPTDDIAPDAIYSISKLAEGALPDAKWYDLLFGNAAGPLGATSVLLIIAGGIYLLLRRISSPKAVLAFIVGAGAVAYLLPENTNVLEIMLYTLLTGQFVFAAFFLASLPGSRVTDRRLELILPCLSGGISVFLAFSGILLAVPYAVLLMNIISTVFCFAEPYQQPFGCMGKKPKKKPELKDSCDDAEAAENKPDAESDACESENRVLEEEVSPDNRDSRGSGGTESETEADSTEE